MVVSERSHGIDLVVVVVRAAALTSVHCDTDKDECVAFVPSTAVHSSRELVAVVVVTGPAFRTSLVARHRVFVVVVIAFGWPW
jgi:hypothetical protein